MNKLISTLLALFSCLIAHSQEEWTLVFHDEFDGDSVNWNIWKSEHGFVRNEEHQWYQPQNAFVENGLLVLEGRLDSIPNPR